MSVPESVGYISGHRKGFRAPPGKDMGLMGLEGKRSSQQGLLRPSYGPHQRRKERGEERRKGRDSASPFLPPPENTVRGAELDKAPR